MENPFESKEYLESLTPQQSAILRLDRIGHGSACSAAMFSPQASVYVPSCPSREDRMRYEFDFSRAFDLIYLGWFARKWEGK